MVRKVLSLDSGFMAQLMSQAAEREKQQQREVEAGDFEMDDELRREMDLDPVFWRNQ